MSPPLSVFSGFSVCERNFRFCGWYSQGRFSRIPAHSRAVELDYGGYFMEKKTMGSFLAALRRANGMTQKELAVKLNVSDKAVSRWETGKNYPDIETLQKLSEIFDTTIDDLLQGNDIEQNRKKRRRKKWFLIILSVAIFLHIFPIHHLTSVMCSDFYGVQEVAYLLYRGNPSHRLEANEVIKQAKAEISMEREGAKVKVWSVHLYTYTSIYEGYVWLSYTEEGDRWYNYPVLLCLEHDEKDGSWHIAEYKEAP